MVKAPEPFLPSSKTFAPELTTPPTLRCPAVMSIMTSDPRLTSPEPRSRLLLPAKANEPFQVISLFVVSVTGNPEALSITVPCPRVKRPVPRAVGELRFSLPSVITSPPEPELAPLSVNAPSPVFVTALLNSTGPDTSNEAPVPETCHT